MERVEADMIRETTERVVNILKGIVLRVRIKTAEDEWFNDVILWFSDVIQTEEKKDLSTVHCPLRSAVRDHSLVCCVLLIALYLVAVLQLYIVDQNSNLSGYAYAKNKRHRSDDYNSGSTYPNDAAPSIFYSFRLTNAERIYANATNKPERVHLPRE